MSVESEASSLLRAIVAPPFPGESVKALIGRAARKGGLTFIRARKLWYREARAILASEMDALRAARRQREEEIALSGQYRDIIQRLSDIEARLDAEGANAARGMVDSPGA